MTDRRAFLSGLIAAPTAILAPRPAMAASLDPLTVARREWLAAHAAYTTGPIDVPESVEDALWDVVVQAEVRATATRPTSVRGAIDALEWAAAEFAEHHHEGDAGSRLMVSLVEGALGVLRTMETPRA